MVYADEEVDAAPGDVVPVVYGDVVTVSYPRERKLAGLEGNVEIFKGSDGEVIPFTKRFKDSSIAVRTQFLIAEAYFELAKRHRQLGDPNLAAEEILAGKKTLEEAIRDYPDTDARAQADYLLANLALEFGNEMADARDTAAEAAKKAQEGPEHDRYLQQVEDRTDRMKKYYAEAVTRFSDIVSTFPESEYAPKAQFKKALTYEKMGQIDQACEEYVKLSYRYPENELVARTIARLGNYFLTKGKMMRDVAKAQEDQIEREKMLMQARKFFKTAGQVLGRLQKRFPAHDLAGKTLVLSAQCYMHAEEHDLAVETFLEIVDDAKKYDPDLVAEGMYWCGDSYMKMEEYVEAYRMFKRLTWDYPASMWAKYARGVLADERLSSVASSEDG
jgi:TolA-binding protein